MDDAKECTNDKTQMSCIEDAINFIDSKDIREYLHSIGYSPKPIEAAFLIYQSTFKTLMEKHGAWDWIIKAIDDVPVPARNWCKGWKSLHQMLRDYMAIENCIIANLMTSNPDAIYRATSENVFGNGGFVRDFDECWEFAVLQTEEYGEEVHLANEAYTDGFTIAKHQITNDPSRNESIYGYFDYRGNIMRVNGEGDLKQILHQPRLDDSIDLEVWGMAFDSMWFNIPIPFERGDIVIDALWGTPFVLTETVPWFYSERGWSSENHGDISDMGASGLCEDCIAAMVEGSPYIGDDEASYLRLQHYEGSTQDKYQYLKAYSSYLKGTIELHEFLAWCRLIKCKLGVARAKEGWPRFR